MEKIDNGCTQVSITLSIVQLERLRRESRERGISVSALVREYIFAEEIKPSKGVEDRLAALEEKVEKLLTPFRLNYSTSAVDCREPVIMPSIVIGSGDNSREISMIGKKAVEDKKREDRREGYREPLKDIAARNRAVGSFDPDEEA